MKKLFFALIIVFAFSDTINAQTSIIGAEAFSVNLPTGFNRTIGTNDFASVQWGNDEIETYGFIITENLDELKEANVSTDLESYMDVAVAKYSDSPKFTSLGSKLITNKKGLQTFQKVISYYNEELESTVYLQFNIFKSKKFMYQVINFGNENFLKTSKESTEYIINNLDIPQS